MEIASPQRRSSFVLFKDYFITMEADDEATGTGSAPAADAASDEEEEEEEEEVEQAGAEAAPPNDANDYPNAIKAVSNLDSLYGLRELGREALCWRLSSAKPGNGVEQLLDPCLETYWQSDGNAQPHWMQLHFGRRVAVSHVCLYLDYQLDESYTPRRVIVEVGMTQQDLIPACEPAELIDPCGWCIIPLQAPPDPLDDPAYQNHASNTQQGLIKTHLIRISVLSMHQNGRDTHVRHVHLYGPRLHTNVLLGSTKSNLAAWDMCPVIDRHSTPAGDVRIPQPPLDPGDGLGVLHSFSSIR